MAMSTNSSSKYNNIISNSVLIHAGPPAVYQLRPKKQEFGTLTRMTVGEKNPNKANKTILLVGETGAGKSTLINTLLNYTMGVRLEDNVWFQIVQKEKKRQTESQTSDVIVYEIFGSEDETLPYSLTIIDTPGYGDTKGIQRDVIISQRLLDLFRSQDGVHEVHAVGLVMKATDNRLNDRLRYILNSVMSLFGKNLEKNIVALITHSDGRRPKNTLQALEDTKIKCAKNEKNRPVFFLFNNCQVEDQTEDEEEEECFEYTDAISQSGMRKFTAFLEKTVPQKLEKTVEVLNERIRLTACIQNLKERIELIELKLTEKKQIQEIIEKYDKEKVKKEIGTVEIDEPYKVKEHINGGMWWLFFYEAATCCTVCEENCHFPGCTVTWYPKHCEVMTYCKEKKEYYCRSCTGKCPASDHVKEKWIYVTKTKKITLTEEDIKEKSEKCENLKSEINQLIEKKSQFLNESYQHVVKLEQIALKVDSLSTFVHLDFLIEKMKERGDTEKVQKLKEMSSREDEGTRAALRYMLASLTQTGKCNT